MCPGINCLYFSGQGSCLMEIGTWSNEMAENISENGDENGDDYWGVLPPNVNMCPTNKGKKLCIKIENY